MENVANLVRQLENETGISPVVVAGEADIDPSTMKRLLKNLSVHKNTANRVRKAVAALRKRVAEDQVAV